MDKVEVELSSGKGGDGSTSFARHARAPLAGPDGGDGGRGGDVVLVAKDDLEDLGSILRQTRKPAEDGRPGESGKCYGKDGARLVVEAPRGTRVICVRSGEELLSLMEDGEPVLLLRGGKGGAGNVKFASASRRTPMLAGDGSSGESRSVEFIYRQPAPLAVLDSTTSGDEYYFRLYADLSGNRVKDFHFYLNKPRRFFWEHGFRRYPIAFLPFQLRQQQSENVRFPNLCHLYYVRVCIIHLGDLRAHDAGAVLGRFLDELDDIEHPHLEHLIAALGGPRFGDAPGEILGEWQRMCNNHPALEGVATEILRLPDEIGEGYFAEVRERIGRLGFEYASGG